eukprot:scaffold7445_cov108-Skeletonema_marinoi.AAC.3
MMKSVEGFAYQKYEKCTLFSTTIFSIATRSSATCLLVHFFSGVNCKGPVRFAILSSECVAKCLREEISDGATQSNGHFFRQDIGYLVTLWIMTNSDSRPIGTNSGLESIS